MMTRTLVVGLLTLFVCGCGGGMSAEEARRELTAIGVAFTPQAFVQAATNGDIAAIELLLIAGIDVNRPVEVQTGRFLTAIEAAAANGHSDVVIALLNAEAWRSSDLWQYAIDRYSLDKAAGIAIMRAFMDFSDPEAPTPLEMAEFVYNHTREYGMAGLTPALCAGLDRDVMTEFVNARVADAVADPDSVADSRHSRYIQEWLATIPPNYELNCLEQ